MVILVGVCAATTSFAVADDGARKMNNVLIVAAEDGPAADLDYLIGTISKRVSKKMKRFEGKTKDYFIKAQKAETIEAVIKQFSPGEAITMLVLSNLSKKPVQEIIDMKTSGAPWPDIAERTGVKLKVVVSDVKDFWLGSG
jgi:hypothetical protein